MRPPYAYIPRLYAPLGTLTRQSLAPSPALTAVNTVATTKRTFSLKRRMSTSSAAQSSLSPPPRSGPTPAVNDAAAATSSQQEQTQAAEGHREHHPTKSTSPAPENATSSAPAAATSTSDSSQQPGKQPLALPPLPEAPSSSGGGDSATMTLDLGGQPGGSASTKLDHLGPLVVHQDGTMSRISNWGEMTEIERQNTLRILAKRNQIRLASLRGEASGEEKAEGNGEK